MINISRNARPSARKFRGLMGVAKSVSQRANKQDYGQTSAERKNRHAKWRLLNEAASFASRETSPLGTKQSLRAAAACPLSEVKRKTCARREYFAF